VIDFGSASYSTALIGNLVTRSNVTVGGNIRLGKALLTSAGEGGDPGQYLTSTGTGIAWTGIDFSTLSDGANTSIVAVSTNVNITVDSVAVASFGNTSLVVEGDVVATGTATTGNLTVNSGEAAAYAVVSNTNAYQTSMSVNTAAGSLAVSWGTNASPTAFMSMTASGGTNQINSVARNFKVNFTALNDALLLYAANGAAVFKSTIASTSTTTGALTVTGGVGIGGNVYTGGFINTSGNVSAATVLAGDINSTGFINTTGNVVATTGVFNNVIVNTGNINAVDGYFVGNGYFLTGIVAGGGSYSNVQVATYLPTYSGNIANVTLGSSGILRFPDGTTQTTAAAGGGSSYGNGNVASYLTSTQVTIANVKLGPSGNITFADGTTQTTAGGGSYSNVQVATYLPT
jgi:hypothetical protein